MKLIALLAALLAVCHGMPPECGPVKECLKQEMQAIVGVSEEDMRGMKRQVMACARGCMNEAFTSGSLGGNSGGGPGGGFDGFREMIMKLQCMAPFGQAIQQCMSDLGFEPPQGPPGGPPFGQGPPPGFGGGPPPGMPPPMHRSKRSPFGGPGAGGPPEAHLMALGYVNEILDTKCPRAAEQTRECMAEATQGKINFDNFSPDQMHAAICAAKDKCDVPECAAAREEMKEAMCTCHEQSLSALGEGCQAPPPPPGCDGGDGGPNPEEFCASDPPSLEQVMEMLTRRPPPFGPRHGPPPPPPGGNQGGGNGWGQGGNQGGGNQGGGNGNGWGRGGKVGAN